MISGTRTTDLATYQLCNLEQATCFLSLSFLICTIQKMWLDPLDDQRKMWVNVWNLASTVGIQNSIYSSYLKQLMTDSQTRARSPQGIISLGVEVCILTRHLKRHWRPWGLETEVLFPHREQEKCLWSKPSTPQRSAKPSLPGLPAPLGRTPFAFLSPCFEPFSYLHVLFLVCKLQVALGFLGSHSCCRFVENQQKQ